MVLPKKIGSNRFLSIWLLQQHETLPVLCHNSLRCSSQSPPPLPFHILPAVSHSLASSGFHYPVTPSLLFNAPSTSPVHRLHSFPYVLNENTEKKRQRPSLGVYATIVAPFGPISLPSVGSDSLNLPASHPNQIVLQSDVKVILQLLLQLPNPHWDSLGILLN